MAEELQDDKDGLKRDLSPEVFIPEELTPVIKDLPEEKQREIIKAVFSISVKKQSSSFRGPLPHPSIIDGYNKVVKDGGERVFFNG